MNTLQKEGEFNMLPKFRAWMKSLKWMCDVTNISFDSKFVDICQQGDTERHTEMSVEFDEVELMQSTGLFDRSGKEIFEGDILELYDEGELLGNTKVVWDKEKAVFMIEAIKIDDIAPFFEVIVDEGYSYSIIGNIYENKGILEEEK